jgi:competence transcription factor ComK
MPREKREVAMANTFPIFTEKSGKRIAINPRHVSNIIELAREEVEVYFGEGASVRVLASLETVIASLTSQGDTAPNRS